MRFMMMVKHAENQGPPPKGFMEVMAKIGEEAVKAGTMVDKRRASRDCREHARPAFQGTDQRHRWAFHRGQGSCRRVCDSGVQVEKRGA